MPVGILSSNGKIKTRFYSLKSNTYKDMEFFNDNMEIKDYIKEKSMKDNLNDDEIKTLNLNFWIGSFYLPYPAHA